jgi:hypothetical protein
MNASIKVARLLFVSVGLITLSTSAKANTVTFHFAPVGSSFSAFLASDRPLVGKQIVSARIYLDVESFLGSDAANFFTDISFPISPFPGNENVLSLFGSDLGWSGSGTFHFFEETTLFNGVFVPARYAGETPGEFFDGILLSGSRIDFLLVPESAGFCLPLLSVAGLFTFGACTRLRAKRIE